MLDLIFLVVSLVFFVIAWRMSTVPVTERRRGNA